MYHTDRWQSGSDDEDDNDDDLANVHRSVSLPLSELLFMFINCWTCSSWSKEKAKSSPGNCLAGCPPLSCDATNRSSVTQSLAISLEGAALKLQSSLMLGLWSSGRCRKAGAGWPGKCIAEWSVSCLQEELLDLPMYMISWSRTPSFRGRIDGDDDDARGLSTALW